MKSITIITIVAAAALATACADSMSWQNDITRLAALSSSSAESLDGDLISASTNMSDKDEIRAPKLDPYEGAAYIKPPRINNYGTVALSYDIDVPPGRAGMQPIVSLAYSSSGGDGMLGIGWELATALGAISRITKNGQLYYDYRDTFAYNGRRLVKVDGPSYSENGTYRMEIEGGFYKFLLSDTETGGVWRMIDTSGTVTTFGETTAYRICRPDDSRKTFTWHFSRRIDLNGNFMTAEYDDSDYSEGQVLYLKEIRYTGNENEGMPALQFVRFEYEGRDEAYVSKTPGFVMKMDRLLDRIIVGWGDPRGFTETSLWSYRLAYGMSEDSNRPLLLAVDTDRKSTKPEFIYQPAQHSFSWAKVENARYADFEENPDSTKYFEGDFNGDGITDMVFFNPKSGDWRAMEGNRNGGYTEKYYAKRFQGYEGDGAIQWFKGNITGDYNGDGMSDIAFYLTREKEFWVAEHTGTQFDFKCYGTLYADIDIFKCEWFPGDFDGNGLSDIVLFNEPTGTWYFMCNTGGKFKFITFSEHFKNLFRSDYEPDIRLDSPLTTDASEFGKDRDRISFFSGDYNGDGRTDISLYDGRSGRWWVGENYRDDAIGFRIAWKLYREFNESERELFAPAKDSLAGSDRFSGDFNGDGFSDFLIFHRDRGEWIFGETGDGTIVFRVFSRTPEFREITRWLPGDFNGDGRTDIGFYSRSDGNFWVGETTPGGFRFRVYSDCADGPDTDLVLAKAPLPRDEVVIRDARSVLAGTGETIVLNYQFDGNYHTGKGEKAFTGHFTGAGTPELLLYIRKDKRLLIRELGGSMIPVFNADLDASGITIVGDTRSELFRNGLDGILYHKKIVSFGSDSHEFNLISFGSTGFKEQTVARFDESTVNDFDIARSLYLTDTFVSGSTNKYILILDDKAEVPRFILCAETTGSNTNSVLNIGGDLPAKYFSDMRAHRAQFRFFSGPFSGSMARVLFVDMTGGTHLWYLGTITEGRINFSRLSGNPVYYGNDIYGQYHVTGGALVYASAPDGAVRFHRLTVGTSGIAQVSYAPLSNSVCFRGEFDHEGNPVVYAGTEIRKAVLGNYCSLEPLNAEVINIKRTDLMASVYPFNWIQGDYNGDGKTDIGIFRMKERRWYFALTNGTVPDLMQSVNNGIGGIYRMTYDNSTRFDNTDYQGIPHLPMNYRVCTSLVVEDGLGGRVRTKYEYAGGYTFSAFINGEKETDYFGFGRFTVIDGAGRRSVSEYHNVPYDDFRLNRALAGAVKTEVLYGSDMVEYERTEHDYIIHTIAETGGQKPSFLSETVASRKYMKGTLAETQTSNIEMAPSRYGMVARTENVTDHYEDAVHEPAIVSHYTRFVNIETTNEMRIEYRRNLYGTRNETTTAYEYDGHGNVVRETARYTGTGLPTVSDRIMEYSYDGYGNRIRSTNASGTPARVRENIFDSILHQFIIGERSYGDAITLETSREINYASAFGSPNTTTDQNGNSCFFEYDAMGRVVRERITADTGVENFQEYEYSGNFPLSVKSTQYEGPLAQLSYEESVIKTRVFADGMGRVIHAVKSATDLPGRRYIKTGMLVYDTAGRIIRKSQTSWVGDDEIDVFKANESEKFPTVNSYDPAGRVCKVTLPEGYSGEPETSTAYVYNGPWETVEIHSAGRLKRMVRNARGQVLYVEESGTDDDGRTVSAKTGYAYDGAGHRVKKMDLNNAQMIIDVPAGLFIPGVKDASGTGISCWRYNAFGELTESSDPDMGYSRVEYNGFGEAVLRSDALSRTTSFSYDRLGRCIEKNFRGDEGTVRYLYDVLPGSENALGRMVAIDDPAQRKEFSYDAIGRVKHERRKMKGAAGVPEFETFFEYDLLSRKKCILYPKDPDSSARMAVSYEYCAMGPRMVRIDTGSVARELVNDIEYNEFGQMIQIKRGNGTITTCKYDNKGRMESLLTTAAHNGQIWKVQDLRYDFKPDNTIAAVENTPDVDAEGSVLSTMKYQYCYDGLNRLVHAGGTYTKKSLAPAVIPTAIPINGDQSGASIKKFDLGFGYAPNGNLTTKSVYDPDSGTETDRWDYSYSNHAVTGIATTQAGTRFLMQYDKTGNMTSQYDNVKNISKQMKYDSCNRIRTVIDPVNGSVRGRYWYDDQGFRVRKVSRQLVEGEEREVEVLYPSMYFGMEKNGAGSLCTNNVFLNGVRMASVSPDGKAQYYLTDHLDSVRVVVDDRGMVVTSHEYLPFGESWITEGDAKNTPKYNSQELDRESGFYFFNARHYDPDIARFVTADSVVSDETSTQSWNRYSYCSNNPIVYRDPTGHVEIPMGQARIGDVMMRSRGGEYDWSEPTFAVLDKVVAKTAAEVTNRIISQTDCKLGHSAIVKQAFKYNNKVVGVWVNDIVGKKIVDRLITDVGSSEWDPINEKWSKIDKNETIDQYKFFRVGTEAEGENAVNKLERAMKDDKIRYDMPALFAGVGGVASLITHSNNWTRNLGKFKDGDIKMVCTELVAWAYYDDAKNYGKLGEVFLALPDQIYQNQKRYDINGQLIPSVDWYKRDKVFEEYNRAIK